MPTLDLCPTRRLFRVVGRSLTDLMKLVSQGRYGVSRQICQLDQRAYGRPNDQALRGMFQLGVVESLVCIILPSLLLID